MKIGSIFFNSILLHYASLVTISSVLTKSFAGLVCSCSGNGTAITRSRPAGHIGVENKPNDLTIKKAINRKNLDVRPIDCQSSQSNKKLFKPRKEKL